MLDTQNRYNRHNYTYVGTLAYTLDILHIISSPKIKAVLETWDLAGDPEKPVPVFARWRHLLRETETSSTAIPSSDR